MENVHWLTHLIFMRIWVTGPKNNDWLIEKVGNCKSDLVLLLNQTKANDGFFHSTTQVNGGFYNCSLKDLSLTSFTTNWVSNVTFP